MVPESSPAVPRELAIATPASPLAAPLQPAASGDRPAADRQDCQEWLSFHRIWGELSDAAIAALADACQLLPLAERQELYRAGQAPAGLYLLKWGSVEIYRDTTAGRTHICYRQAGELFGYVPLLSGGEARYQAGAIARSTGQAWFISRTAFQDLVRAHPELQGRLSSLLAADLAHFAQRIAHEQARLQALPAYLRAVPETPPPFGPSKAAQTLRRQIEVAATTLQPVVLQGPLGSGKTLAASLIHRASGLSDRPFAELDCAQLPRDAAGIVEATALFGRADGSLGVLPLLERGTLLVENVHLLAPDDRDRLNEYLQTNHYRPAGSETPVRAWVRLILASPQPLPWLQGNAQRIKLFSLSQRKQDVPILAADFLARFSRQAGRSPLQLDPADQRRLLGYGYPGNIAELASILQRAVTMTPGDRDTIPEQVLWSVQSAKNAFRIDLLNELPWLRRFLLSAWWPERFWWPMMAIFIPVTALGFLGPQTRGDSITLNLFWAWWWPGYLFLFAFVGRVWCAVCPFMIVGEGARALSLWLWPRQLLPWPTAWLNRWGAWLLFAGFLAIYLWEELWDLPHTAYLSSWLLLAITAGAVVCSLIWERRLWCRYLCPIGGMNGLFAKLAMTELRSTQQVCGSQCQTFGCYRGSDATPVLFADALPTEGQATGGCPLYSHPAQLPDNRDCVLCMTCLKACPNRSVQLNLRFPATDLLEDHRGNAAEVALLLMLLGGPLMHAGPRLLAWLHLDWPLDAGHLASGLPLAIALLAFPGLLVGAAWAIARWLDSEHPDFRTVAYAYLPLTLAANLAYYTPAAIGEAGEVLPVLARTLGFSGAGWPALTWSPDVATFLQGIVLLSGLAFSIYPLQRMTQRPWWRNGPHWLLFAGFIIGLFYLLV